MSFLSINNSIITDSYGDLYSFQIAGNGVQVIIHRRQSGNAEKQNIVEGRVMEYDVAINDEDDIYLVCQKEDTSISIYTFKNNQWLESKIASEMGTSIYNLRILIIDNEVNLFYSIPKSEYSDKVSIYHHCLYEDKWITNLVDNVNRREIINTIEAVSSSEGIVIGYYDSIGQQEEIFIKVYDTDNKLWGEKVQVTNNSEDKLYLDLLKIDDYLHIVYSRFNNGNLIIEHNKVDISGEEISIVSKNILSGWANCSYPTITYDNEKLWVIWTEYDNVVSAYSIDKGDNWSNPYVWKDSKGVDFLRYKFDTNEGFLKQNFITKYSFGKDYPELTLLGFGNLENAEESIKKKDGSFEEDSYSTESDVNYMSEYNDVYSDYEDDLSFKIKDLEKRLDDINNKIDSIKHDIRNMEFEDFSSLAKRVSEIEQHLNRRRSPFGARF